jgi:hypothetical protein
MHMAGDILSLLTGLALLIIGARDLLTMYRGDRDPTWGDGARRWNIVSSIQQTDEAATYWMVFVICFAILVTGIWVTVEFGTKLLTSFR